MRLRYKKFIILFTLGIMLIGMATFSLVAPNVNFSIRAGSNSAKTATGSALSAMSEKEIESDITMLVKNYLDAKQRVDMEELEECVSDISHIDEKRLVTEAEYIEKYKNIECTIRNDGMSEGTYRVYVYSEAKIYDIDTLVPSLTALYVTADANGKFMIYLNKIDSENQKAIGKLDDSTEIRKLIDSVQKKLESIVSKNADVRDFYQMLESSGEDDSQEDNEGINKEANVKSSSAPKSTPKASGSAKKTNKK